jgi:hypothetical protein
MTDAVSAHAPPGGAAVPASTHPPVTPLAMASLGLVLVGGIIMVGNYGNTPSLVIPVALLAVSFVLLAASVVMLTRDRGFAWPLFFRVGRWALLAYGVIAGMIEFSFIHNNTTGTALLVLTLMLVMFALIVPLSIGFTVARFA